MLTLRPLGITLSEHDVRRAFKCVNSKKAVGLDSISVRVLQLCADQLAMAFKMIFNLSLAQSAIPTCFNKSTIIPVPMKTRPACLNDYRVVELNSVVMKCFEQLVEDSIHNLPTVPTDQWKMP